MYVDVDAYFEVHVLNICGFWFFESVGGEVIVDVQFFGCIF